jgi:hypothetical protein
MPNYLLPPAIQAKWYTQQHVTFAQQHNVQTPSRVEGLLREQSSRSRELASKEPMSTIICSCGKNNFNVYAITWRYPHPSRKHLTIL